MNENIAASVGVSTVGAKQTTRPALPSLLPTVLRDRRPRSGLRSVPLAQLSQLRQIWKRELTTANSTSPVSDSVNGGCGFRGGAVARPRNPGGTTLARSCSAAWGRFRVELQGRIPVDGRTAGLLDAGCHWAGVHGPVSISAAATTSNGAGPMVLPSSVSIRAGMGSAPSNKITSTRCGVVGSAASR